MSRFLTNEDLQALTGSPQKSRQVEWLKARGWVFELTLSGHPVVLADYAKHRMGMKAKPPRRVEPNYAALQVTRNR